MKPTDRFILIALMVGVWALVLKPGTPVAHHANAGHNCSASGDAVGELVGKKEVKIYDFRGMRFFCNHF